MKSARTLRWLMQQRGGGYSPLLIPGLLFFNSYKSVTPTDAYFANSANHPSPDRRIVFTGPSQIVGILTGPLSSPYGGSSTTLAGYANPGNNGTFPIASANSAGFTGVNAAGVTENPPPGAATISIPGLASTYSDLVAGHTFTQATALNKYAVDTSVIPGTQVLGCSSNVLRSMTCVSAPLAGALDGSGDATFFTYFRPTAVAISGNTSTWLSFRDAANTNRVTAVFGTTTSVSLVEQSAAGSSTQTGVLSTPLTLNAWQLLAVTLVGTTATWYLNGVQVATNTTGVVRTRAGMDRVVIAWGGTSGHRAIDAAVARAMTAAELLSLTGWCQAEYA